MNKKNIIYLLILIVLIAFAGWLLTDKEKGYKSIERTMDYDFTIEDTASIDKIIIRDKKPNEVILSKVNGTWMVNGDHKARKDAMNTLLETLHRMEMRNFIPERMKPTVVSRMAVHGKEVEIYQNGKLFKTIFVGTEAQDELATYMMIKGSDAPYAVHIPGFNGFLSTRFFTSAILWRSRDIFGLDPNNIRTVQMLYPDSTETSFKLDVFSQDSLYVSNLQSGKVLRQMNGVNAKLFLAAFRNLKYEGAIVPTDPIWKRQDSLLASVPVFLLEVKDHNGKTHKLQGYKIKGPAEVYDPDMEAPVFDPDKMHGFINESEMVLLQYYGLRNILKPYSFFQNQ